MPVEDFIIKVFCLVDYILKRPTLPPLRKRGFAPAMSDSEVITIEIVGEFLGHHEDKSIWRCFSTHWRHFFPIAALYHMYVIIKSSDSWQNNPIGVIYDNAR